MWKNRLGSSNNKNNNDNNKLLIVFIENNRQTAVKQRKKRKIKHAIILPAFEKKNISHLGPPHGNKLELANTN